MRPAALSTHEPTSGIPLIAARLYAMPHHYADTEIFGDYVSIYNFRQSIEDNATVPLFYENRIPDLMNFEKLIGYSKTDVAQEISGSGIVLVQKAIQLLAQALQIIGPRMQMGY